MTLSPTWSHCEAIYETRVSPVVIRPDLVRAGCLRAAAPGGVGPRQLAHLFGQLQRSPVLAPGPDYTGKCGTPAARLGLSGRHHGENRNFAAGGGRHHVF